MVLSATVSSVPPWRLSGSRQWVFLWSLSTAQLVSWGIFYYAFAVVMEPMERELGWSRAELTGGVTAALLISGVCAPWIGHWIDRHGPRGLMSLASLAGTILVAAWAMVDRIEVFYLVFILLGAVMSATLYEPAFTVLTRAFPRDYRRAITMMTLLAGLASTAFIPLTQWLIERYDWRPSLMILAAINLACSFVVHWLVLPAGWKPEQDARTMTAEPAGARPVRRALRSPVFWLLCLSFTGYALVFTALTFHLVPLLRDREVAMDRIVLVYTLIGPLQVAGRLVVLALARWMDARRTGVVITAFLPLSVLLLILTPPTVAWLAAFVFFYGTANGILTIVRGTIVQELLGTEGIGTVNGLLALPATGARAGGPLVAALLLQVFGQYDSVLWAIFGAACAAAIGFWLAVLAAPNRPSQRVTT